MSPVIGADVSDDLKERVDDAREEGENRSAAVRRLLRDGLEAQEDGGHGPRPDVITSMVRELGAIWAAVGILALLLTAINGPLLTPVEWASMAISAFVLTSATTILQFTSLPERADDYLYRTGQRVVHRFRGPTGVMA